MYVAPDDSYLLQLSVSDPRKATKVGAIVGGQTSCKAPELAAFDKHLPPDVEILSCHSLHGPNVNPKGQPLVGAYLTDIPGQDRLITFRLLGTHPASSYGQKPQIC